MRSTHLANLLLLLAPFLLSSCLSSVGSSIVKGAKEESVEELGEQLIRGIRKDLKYVSSDLVEELDSSFHESGLSAYLESALTGPVRSLDTLLLRGGQDAFFERLGASLTHSVRDIRLELVGEDALLDLMRLREEIIGEQLQASMLTLIDSSMSRLGAGYREQIYPDIDQTAELLAKTILEVSAEVGDESRTLITTGVEGGNKLLWTACGAIAILLSIAAFLVMAYQRQKKTLRLVAKEVVHNSGPATQFGSSNIQERIAQNLRDHNLSAAWREALSSVK